MPQADPSFFQASTGVLTDSPSYVERDADRELRRLLLAREHVLLLSSRKVGKTSLIFKSFATLRQMGTPGEQATAYASIYECSDDEERFYRGLAQSIFNSAFNDNPWLEGVFSRSDWLEWWRSNGDFAPTQRFLSLLEEFLLKRTDAVWHIAIDEIDTLLELPFSDNVLAAIRHCHNARNVFPDFHRLVFVLVGVTTPGRLQKSAGRTPFNYGELVDLEDMTAAQAAPLLRGLGEQSDTEHPALHRTLHWTGGHPYLTQVVFEAIAERRVDEPEMEPIAWQNWVDEAVDDKFITHLYSQKQDWHLDYLESDWFGLFDDLTKEAILRNVDRVQKHGKVRDDNHSRALLELKLSGILVSDPEDPRYLIIRNNLYRKIFDREWVKEHMPPRPQRRARLITYASVCLFLISILLSTLAYQASVQRRIDDLRNAMRTADQDVPMTEFETLISLDQGSLATNLLGEFWRKKARKASYERPRDEALIYWLKALAIEEHPEARIQSHRAFGNAYSMLEMTYRANSTVSRAGLNRDSTLLITSHEDASLKFWDKMSGRLIRSIPSAGREFAFSEDGTRMISWDSPERKLTIWDTHRNEQIDTLPATGRLAAISRDGRRIAYVEKYILSILDTATKETFKVYDTGHTILTSLGFGGNGSVLGIGEVHGTSKVYDVDNRIWLSSATNDASVSTVQFDNSGSRVVVASHDKTASVWDVRSGHRIGKPISHEHPINFAEFDPSGELVVTGAADGSVTFWDASSGRQIGKSMYHSRSVNSGKFSLEGNYLVTASDDHTARVWEVATQSPVGYPLVVEAPVIAASFCSSNDNSVITVGLHARLWSSREDFPPGLRITHSSFIGKPLGRSTYPKELEKRLGWGHPALFEADVWSQRLDKLLSNDGKWMLAGVGDSNALVWSIESGMRIGLPIEHPKLITAADFSPDGSRIASGCEDGVVRIWETGTGHLLRDFPLSDGPVLDVIFTQDGEKLITLAEDGKWPHPQSANISICNANTGQVISEMKNMGWAHPMTTRPFSRKTGLDFVETKLNNEEFFLFWRNSTNVFWRVLPEKASIQQRQFGTNRWIEIVSLFGSNEGTFFVCKVGLPRQQRLVLISFNGTRKMTGFGHRVNGATFNTGGSRVAVFDSESVAVFETRSLKTLGKSRIGHQDTRALGFIDDNKLMLTTPSKVHFLELRSVGIIDPLTTHWSDGGVWSFSYPIPFRHSKQVWKLDPWTGNELVVRRLADSRVKTNNSDLFASPTEALNEVLRKTSLAFETTPEGVEQPNLVRKFPFDFARGVEKP